MFSYCLPVTPLDVVKVRLQRQQKPKATAPSRCGAKFRPRVTPLDVVKIRLQAQQQLLSKGSKFLYCNGLMDHVCTVQCQICADTNGMSTAAAHKAAQEWYARPGRFNGTLDAFVKIARFEGISSLWSGLPPTLVMAVPSTVVYFTTYDHLKYRMGYRETDASTKNIPILAGSVARVIATTVINPLELIRTKMQSEQLSYSQIGLAVSRTLKQDGLLGIMRGLGPSLYRDVPFSALYWYGYEYLKALQLQETGDVTPTFWQSFLAGAVSGTVAAVITLPFDVIKTHRQIDLGNKTNGQTTSTGRLMFNLYRHNGVSALFAGLLPRVLKVAPACAIMISSYEVGKAFFRKYNMEKLSPAEEL